MISTTLLVNNREELLLRIDIRSRMSSRASSSATSPRQIAARLQELSEKLPENKIPLETHSQRSIGRATKS
jgi:hypothetical protein